MCEPCHMCGVGCLPPPRGLSRRGLNSGTQSLLHRTISLALELVNLIAPSVCFDFIVCTSGATVTKSAESPTAKSERLQVGTLRESCLGGGLSAASVSWVFASA